MYECRHYVEECNPFNPLERITIKFPIEGKCVECFDDVCSLCNIKLGRPIESKQDVLHQYCQDDEKK